MTGNTSTAVPTCQFQPDPINYCSVSSMPPPNFNNSHIPNNFYYSTSIEPQHQFVSSVHQNNSIDTHNIYYQNYHQFYDPQQIVSHNIVDTESFGFEIPKTSEEIHYELQQPLEMNRKTDLPDESWSHGDPGQSQTNQQPQIDPCAQVVQVLQCYHQGGEEPEFVRKAIESLVKKLKDKRTELDALISAVTSGGKEQTSCVTIQRSLDGRLQVAGRKGVPHVVYARIWRWPNVNKNELQKMDICSIPNEHQDLICINPFHYERVVSSGYGNIDLSTLNQRQNTGMDYQGGYSMENERSPGNLLPAYANSQLSQSQMYINKDQPMNAIHPSLNQTIPGYSGDPSNSYPGNSTFGLMLPNKLSTLFMYGPNQQPSCVITHQPDNRNIVVNQYLPSFVKEDYHHNGEWKSQQQYLPENAPLLERYAALRYIMQNDTTPIVHKNDFLLSDWCSISYYELDTQIGETFNIPLQQSEIIVDGGMDPGGTRLGRICLGALSNVHRTEASERARMGIGKGIKLKYQQDGSVILECLSEKGVFLRSNYMDFENNVIYGSTVHKFSSGASKKIFDLKWAYTEMYEQRRAAQRAYEEQQHAIAGSHATPNILDRSVVGVDDLRRVCCTIAISFVKGWGAGYTRASIKETPCWIELQLHRPLQLLNNLLQT
uniref:Mothers against decapentaplegic homolog n=1 Tax=Panagrolaimus superbus TaxID=310955 RepID=A0A914Z9B8_9BILA